VSKKAIIVAAGRGRRLEENTDEIPKCMVPVAGRPILHWQLAALTTVGVDDIVIVRGYRGDRIDPGPTKVRYVDNPAWAENNILTSLFYAREEFSSGFFFSYCDIVYTKLATQRLAEAASRAEVSLIVDRDWVTAYAGRSLHPVSEAELTRVDKDTGWVRRVGKGAVPEAEAVGEFIGLAHFSSYAAAALATIWDEAMHIGFDAPFGRATALRQAYLTDGLNALIDRGHHIAPVYIDGEWREIDTPQDLAAAVLALPRWSR
jgi:choline kinase